MSSSRTKVAKSKSNSHKKLRKSIHETAQDKVTPFVRCNIGIQTATDNKKCSSEHSSKKISRDPSICKSLENIMHLKSVSNDTVSMSKTDISVVYGMYKVLVAKHNVNNEIHGENYQRLLNELNKIESQLNEQNLHQKSLINLVTALVSRHGLGQRTRRKRNFDANKMMLLKLSQIASVIYKLQCSAEALEAKTLDVDFKIQNQVKAEVLEKIPKTKKKPTFCCCM